MVPAEIRVFISTTTVLQHEPESFFRGPWVTSGKRQALAGHDNCAGYTVD